MQKTSIFLLYLSLLIGSASVLYFMSLVVGIPVLIVAIIWIVCAYVGFKNITTGLFDLKQNVADDSKDYRWAYLILIAGLCFIVSSCYEQAEKYGGWDAWWFWNYHAKFLSTPDVWAQAYLPPEVKQHDLLSPRVSHADYPLMLPASVAFFWRLFNTQSCLIPYGIAFLFTCIIPVTIFLETYRKNMMISSILYLALANSAVFNQIGISQMADIILAFFYLASFILMHHFIVSGNSHYLVLCGITLGLAIWTKNEGLVLAVIFIIFYLPKLWHRISFLKLVSGMAVPLATFVLFKAAYTPSNDMIENQGLKTLAQISDLSRYQLIYDSLWTVINRDYPAIKVGLTIYIIMAIFHKGLFTKELLIILFSLFVYLFTYLLTPHNLEWHVNTSLTRILIHLIPATVYIFSLSLSESSFSQQKQDF